MGNVYLSPRMVDLDIEEGEITDNCKIICLTSPNSNISINDEIVHGRAKLVSALTIKQILYPPQEEPIPL